MKKILEDYRTEVIQNIDPERKASAQHFFKEEVKIYGLKMTVLDQIGKKHFTNLADKSKEHVFLLCEELWKSGMMEESFTACNWCYAVRKQYKPEDFKIFEKWIENYVNNWASCDTLCNHSVGTLIEMYPDKISGLKIWAHSQNRWVKRASAVSLIVPARRGKFLNDVLEIASILLTDSDDMVQKGYGWMLKEASKTHQNEIYDFVTGNRHGMPRTAYRYAIEKMPPDLRKKAMAL